MGLGNLDERSEFQTILHTWFNELRSAFLGAIVGRNASGVPEAGQDVGTPVYPFGTGYFQNLSVGGSIIDFESLEGFPYKIVSGKTRSTSNQPAFLVPNGAAASAVLDANPTPLVLEINGETVSIESDVSLTGLTVAPSSQNTCLVNDADAVADMDSRLYGEDNNRFTDKNFLLVDTMGTNISAKVGQYAAFKITHGGNTEYFLAFVQSTGSLSDVKRGYFYDSSLNPINRIAIADNDPITLMSLAWVFAKSDGTCDVHYKNPTISASEPSGPASNDYWFDMANRVWKQYDGAAWNEVERALIGLLVIDSSNCVAARSFDFFATYQDVNTLEIQYESASVVKSSVAFATVGVLGNIHRFFLSKPSWSMASHLAAAADLYDSSEQASRRYYFYLSDTGLQKISDIAPYWRPDFKGWYHPHNPWRYVGHAENDGSSNFVLTDFGIKSERTYRGEAYALSTSSVSFTGNSTSDAVVTNLNASITVREPCYIRAKLISDINSSAVNKGHVGLSAPSLGAGEKFPNSVEITLFRSTSSAFSSETAVTRQMLEVAFPATSDGVAAVKLPSGSIELFDFQVPGPGKYYYRIKYKLAGTNGGAIASFTNSLLLLEVKPKKL